MDFTPNQRQAINHGDSNLQLIACAGSGKTEVVARRVARLLKNGLRNGLSPRNIVAFTFTEKAAAELKERIIARCQQELGHVHGKTRSARRGIRHRLLAAIRPWNPYHVQNVIKRFADLSLTRRDNKRSRTNLRPVHVTRA
jgi:superfamily I DNA/RNA helicase